MIPDVKLYSLPYHDILRLMNVSELSKIISNTNSLTFTTYKHLLIENLFCHLENFSNMILALLAKKCTFPTVRYMFDFFQNIHPDFHYHQLQNNVHDNTFENAIIKLQEINAFSLTNAEETMSNTLKIIHQLILYVKQIQL